MIENDGILSMLSLAARGRRLVSGGFMTEKAIDQGQAKLVLLAGDASGNTKKRFSDRCAARGIPCVEYADGASLGARIGKESRMTLAVTDAGFAEAILKKLSQI